MLDFENGASSKIDGWQTDFSVSPRPFGFSFETKGLGPGLDNSFFVSCQGLTIVFVSLYHS